MATASLTRSVSTSERRATAAGRSGRRQHSQRIRRQPSDDPPGHDSSSKAKASLAAQRLSVYNAREKIMRFVRVGLLLIVSAATLSAQRGRGGEPSAPTAPTPPGPPRVEELKREAAAEVETMRVMTQQMVDQVFSYAELGFQETETSRYLTDILQKNGFRIERAYAGMATAWVATWGSGKPVIAIGSDIDCIPQASQKPGVAYHDPLIEGAPGHGEGHNSGVPLNITAALAVKKIMEREKLPGTLKLWPGVAEELVGAKAYFIRAGLFRDVDVSLFAHVGNNLGVSWGGGTGTGL